MSAKISLSNGGYAIVDDCDVDLVANRNWYRCDAAYTSYAIDAAMAYNAAWRCR